MLAAVCLTSTCNLITLYLRRPRRLSTRTQIARGCGKCGGPVQLVPGDSAPAVWSAIEGAALPIAPGVLRTRFDRARQRLEHRAAVKEAVQAACEGQPWFIRLEAQNRALALLDRAAQRKRAQWAKWGAQARAAAHSMHRSREAIVNASTSWAGVPRERAADRKEREIKIARFLEAADRSRSDAPRPFRRRPGGQRTDEPRD